MPELYRVVRTFSGPGSRRLYPGDIVEAGDWRNVSKLVEAGRLIPTDRPAPQASPETEAPRVSRHQR